jgi:hypothetical protein
VLPYAGNLWLGTRIANLSHVRIEGNRRYFDLELTAYPSNNVDALARILRPLVQAGDAPFSRWVAISDRDEELELLQEGAASANWTAVVDQIGSTPSQFAGDSFWRIAKLVTGKDRSPLAPKLRDHVETRDGEQITTRVDAIYPVQELESLGIEIESRMPEGGDEPADDGGHRIISFAASAEGPLRGFDTRSLRLRRYALEWMDTEVWPAPDSVDTCLS